jgi:hypothetical protein
LLDLVLDCIAISGKVFFCHRLKFDHSSVTRYAECVSYRSLDEDSITEVGDRSNETR